MNLQVEKLELLQMVLDTNNQDALVKIKAILKEYATASKQDDTAYLLSSTANKKHLQKSIAQLEKGQGKAIKTADLWK